MRHNLLLITAALLFGISVFAKNKTLKADIVVALDGSGNFTKIQDAIDAVPSNSEKRTVIFIKKGIYNTEKLVVPQDKKNITMIGESRDETMISYHIYDCKEGGLNNKCPAEDAAKWSKLIMQTSATIALLGDGFQAQNLTFSNTAGPVGQAPALVIDSDKNIFVNCSFKSYQDTIYFRKLGKRSYFANCLIEGRTDYIYGSGIVYFEACEIHSFGGGWITAPSTPLNQPYGFIFNKCRLTYASGSPRTGDDGNKIALGRPWHFFPKVAWIKCNMCKEIDPLGWPTTWRMDYAATSADLHLYEYKNIGPGADMSNRAKWVGIRALSDQEARDYTLEKVMAGNDKWNPYATLSIKNK